MSTKNAACSDCMRGDEILRNLVGNQGKPGCCSYCGLAIYPVLFINDLAGYVFEQIKSEYEPYVPASNYDGFEEVLYLGTNDILADVLDYHEDVGGIHSCYQLIGDLCHAIDARIAPSKAWRARSNKDVHGANLLWSWETFVREIKYHRRFHFLTTTKSEILPHSEFSAANVLKTIADAINEMGLIHKLKAGEKIHRARVAKRGEVFAGKEQLGAPKCEDATTQRMNPPGIPYFYAASDLLTACAEVCGDTPEISNIVYVGTWEATRDLSFVDLSKLGELPSFFDSSKRKSRATHIFLRDFIRDVCSSLPEDDKAQLTYIPAQVVAEYFRTALKLEDGKKVDGVIFTSTKNPDGKCVVVFPRDNDYGSPFDKILKLLPFVEKKLVGVAPDLIIPRMLVENLSSPWEMSAYGRS